VPERIGNAEKARAWAEKIVQRSQNINSSRSETIFAKNDARIKSHALASSQNTRQNPKDIINSEGASEGHYQHLETQDIQTSQDESVGEKRAEKTLPGSQPINPVVVANKVYRLMQKDLLLQIERAGK